MASLLFKLNNVPDDEADEIRALLDDGEIDYYETSSGNWGLSFAAIWLKDKQQLPVAQQLLDQYQSQRYERVSQEHQSLRETGQNTTWWQVFRQSPIKVVVVLVFVSLIVYFSIKPFFPA